MRDLDKITAIVKYVLEVNTCEVTGFVDSSAKFLACFLSVKLTDLSLAQIGYYYKIYPPFLENKMQEMAIEVLVNETFKKEVSRVSALYNDLELITNK